MKKVFFLKWLPVEGKLEIGDTTFWDDDEGYFAKQFVTVSKGFYIHACAMGWKKFKLFLCSRDILVGDELPVGKVHDIHRTQRKAIIFSEEGNFEDSLDNLFKVMGELSPGAYTFAKEGMEFDEEEIERIYQINDGLWSTVTETAYKEYLGKRPKRHFIKLLGPCQHFH